MRITCPRCEAAYEVPEMMLSAGLSSGRAVRCARCGERWVPLVPPTRGGETPGTTGAVPATLPEAEKAGASSPVPPDRGASSLTPEERAPAPPRSPTGVAWAWLVSVAVVAALLLLFVVMRDDIAAAWPPSLRLYRALGLV